MFLVHIESTFVYRFPRAHKIQWLSSLMWHRGFHYHKYIIIRIVWLVEPQKYKFPKIVRVCFSEWFILLVLISCFTQQQNSLYFWGFRHNLTSEITKLFGVSGIYLITKFTLLYLISGITQQQNHRQSCAVLTYCSMVACCSLCMFSL